MQKIISIVILLSTAAVITAFADDIIVFKNGDIVNSKVIEITSSDVKYKKSSNPKGPTYSIDKADILSIKYENGETDKFDQPSVTPTNNSDKLNLALPDGNNEIAKTKYSSGTYSSSKKMSDKQAKSASFFLKFTKESIVSSKELNVKFEPGFFIDGKWYSFNDKIPWTKQIAIIQYRIHVINKTNKTIYLDLGKSSKLDEINGFMTYYDDSKVVNSTSESSGCNLNLGIVSIGGGSSESTTIVQKDNRFITLAPKASFIIPAKQKFHPFLKEPYKYYETFSNLFEAVPFSSKFDGLRERESKYYNEDDSPIKINYKLTYSSDKDFTHLTEMDFTLYAYQVIGLPILWEKWSGNFRDTFKNFTGLDDTFIGGSIMFEL